MAVRLLHYSDLENVYDTPERAGRLAGRLADRDGSDAVVVGTGDNTAPGILSMVTEGRQALDFFAAVEPDVDTFGNHDFDYGLDATREIVRESPQTWLSANVRYEGEVFGADAGVVPATVVETDGARVGFTGVTEPRTASMCPGATDLTFTDPVAAAEREVGRLRERGVDAVVVCSHLGNGDDELARATDADAILGGHVHDERVTRIDGTLCTRPGANGHRVFEVDLGSGAVERHAVADGPLDEAVTSALRDRRETTGLDAVVGHVDRPIERDLARTRSGECRIGNFVADAYRWAAGADVGLQNSGGIREGPPLSGAVTVADLVGVIPFDEPVAVAEVTGAELLAACRQADGRRLPALSDSWHAHVSGLSLTQTTDGEVTVRYDGGPLDPDATYTVATSDYVLHTDHEFPSLAEAHRVDTLDTQYEVLAAYAREEGIDPEIEGRIEPATLPVGDANSNIDTEG
jgi:2',3'-cyclic-nucleotide 2'-phosphodiesterase (5'-nucleotidase family)